MNDTNEPQEAGDIVIKDKILREPFVQMPVALIRCSISNNAKIAWAVLVSYGQSKGRCFPGQARMAVDMGVERKAVARFIKELVDAKFVTVKRRGQGKTNLYTIEELSEVPLITPPNPDVPKMGHLEVHIPDVLPEGHLDGGLMGHLNGPPMGHKVDTEEVDTEEVDTVLERSLFSDEVDPKLKTKAAKDKAHALRFLGGLSEERRTLLNAIVAIRMWSKFRYKPASLESINDCIDKCPHIDHLYLAKKAAAYFEGIGKEIKAVTSLTGWWERDETKATDAVAARPKAPVRDTNGRYDRSKLKGPSDVKSEARQKQLMIEVAQREQERALAAGERGG